MLYAEHFRHFVQEWLEVTPPKKLKTWPWRKNSKLYLINLFAVPADERFTEMPAPLISILINNLEDEPGAAISPSRMVHYGYFQNPEGFQLPRQYILNPTVNGGAVFKTNRYSFTSDGSQWLINDWNKNDLAILRVLGKRPHQRCSIYDSESYQMLRNRLNTIGRDRHHIQSAENLLDFTDRITGTVPGVEDPEFQKFVSRSPETILIQAPIAGLLAPIKKTKDHTLINGAMILSKESVRYVLEDEPAFEAYATETTPFAQLGGMSGYKATFSPYTRTVVYMVIEVPNGTFAFNEYMSAPLESNGVKYFRSLTHHYVASPEVNKGAIEIRLKHSIIEGCLPIRPETAKLLSKSGREKLFHRADMPKGFLKSANGSVVGPTLQWP